jgi:hypothetical protein
MIVKLSVTQIAVDVERVCIGEGIGLRQDKYEAFSESDPLTTDTATHL